VITIKIEFEWYDGLTTSIEKSYTTTTGGFEWLNDDDIFALIRGNALCKCMRCYAKTNKTSTSVTVDYRAYGVGVSVTQA